MYVQLYNSIHKNEFNGVIEKNVDPDQSIKLYFSQLHETDQLIRVYGVFINGYVQQDKS